MVEFFHHLVLLRLGSVNEEHFTFGRGLAKVRILRQKLGLFQCRPERLEDGLLWCRHRRTMCSELMTMRVLIVSARCATEAQGSPCWVPRFD